MRTQYPPGLVATSPDEHQNAVPQNQEPFWPLVALFSVWRRVRTGPGGNHQGPPAVPQLGASSHLLWPPPPSSPIRHRKQTESLATIAHGIPDQPKGICIMTGTVLLSSSLPGRTDLRCSVSKRLPGAYVCVLLSYFISSACDVAASNCADPRFPLTEFGHQGSHECLPPQTPPPRRPPSHRTTHPTQLLRPLRTPFIR